MTDATDTDRRPRIRLRPGRHKRAAAGHPWVFSNEIEMDAAARALPAGGIVDLLRADGGALATAYFNPHTLIAARILAEETGVPVDADFLAARLHSALALRETLFDTPHYRLVHAEADGLPGLIVDRYGDTVVLQANTAGMQSLTDMLVATLEQVLPGIKIVLKNDAPARRLEGLDDDVRVLRGEPASPLPLVENGLTFYADPLSGQKTGWFYDHRANRAYAAALARRLNGPRVLDCYAYAGGFAVACAAAGAAEVLAVDRSEAALALAERAAAANDVGDRCRFRRGEAFATLTELTEAGTQFDLVIADPPAFAKARRDIKPALKGYRKLTRLAAAAVAPGGFLILASCSHHVDGNALLEAAGRGLRDAGRAARVLRRAGADADHPVHPRLPESAYLKTLVIQLD
ncbi:putative SAM-dependent methyltransferase [Salinisphaera sp. PC39]|uniref:class I SAM-dependent rRNA methyltransferase n=1 Tax=Salinisphaera sp. PC39 TaxID=1304156 RepID=UPI003341964E